MFYLFVYRKEFLFNFETIEFIIKYFICTNIKIFVLLKKFALSFIDKQSKFCYTFEFDIGLFFIYMTKNILAIINIFITRYFLFPIMLHYYLKIYLFLEFN